MTQLEKDEDLRALSRFEIKMALNYMVTDERSKAAMRLETALRHLNQDLDGVVNSIKTVNQQMEMLNTIK